MVAPDRPQMKIWYGACALHARYQRLQTHSQNIALLQQQLSHERALLLRYK